MTKKRTRGTSTRIKKSKEVPNKKKKEKTKKVTKKKKAST